MAEQIECLESEEIEIATESPEEEAYSEDHGEENEEYELGNEAEEQEEVEEEEGQEEVEEEVGGHGVDEEDMETDKERRMKQYDNITTPTHMMTSMREQDESEGEIARRTRSKFPLVNTDIEDIEGQMIALESDAKESKNQTKDEQDQRLGRRPRGSVEKDVGEEATVMDDPDVYSNFLKLLIKARKKEWSPGKKPENQDHDRTQYNQRTKKHNGELSITREPRRQGEAQSEPENQDTMSRLSVTREPDNQDNGELSRTREQNQNNENSRPHAHRQIYP
ncbi:cyclic nucleotide-gated cation channel beta-1-like [Gigantopelta aegis]|uniref:cyclic nucleotide-gated cation channel beta-1-like n=1 Tax=Gigantopelta aegis TaxID=1735272 RepID=UPI001B88D828|nr:cyclic nucleotide-gated cation channel beta-1-like [Gigantopelta aegis]